MLDAPCPFQLLYGDATLLVLDKPAGLLAVPGKGAAGEHNLTAMVQARFADARVVHRLDMATSGLMLFARGASAQRQLSMAFAARAVGKRYVAVIEGLLADEAGEVDAPLAPDWPNRPRQVVSATRGKAALTRWRVLERLAGCTRVELEPVTGRSHQLRVHMQSIGHPIRGDALYAPETARDGRLLLHATELAFAHPADGRHCRFTSAAPF
jgi:tRNA pseudouridine32 synthase/23S rRNA pseudouridine746 synthase